MQASLAGFTLVYFALTLTPPPAEHGEEPQVANAAEAANWKDVERLVSRGVDVNLAQLDGMTALHWACYHDQPEITQLLLRAKADAGANNRYGVTPLALACTNGNAGIVEQLLTAGSDPNSTLRGGETALMTAARTGKPQVVNLLLQHGAEVNAREQRGQTSLMWAAAAGHPEVVKLLLAAKADAHKPLKSGFTPFFFAVRQGHQRVVDVFVAAGVDVRDVMKPEKTSAKSVRNQTSALLLAVENGHFELASHLLDLGADPNDQRSGFSALHALTWVRKPNRGDGADGDPAPVGSGRLNSFDLVRDLVDHGADVNLRLQRGRSGRGHLNHRGATPLLLAAKTNDVPYIQLLLELGANAKLTNHDASTPLMAAAGVGTRAPGEEAGTEDEAVATVKLLLAKGADLNAVDRNGETAMHGAAYKSLPQVVLLLNQHGARIEVWNQPNKYGWTPHLIAEGHRPGNFKPSAETLNAIRRVMRERGVTPPKLTPQADRPGYTPP